MKLKLTPVKGTIDYLPKEAITRKLIIDKVVETYQKNGFLLVKTPVLENLDILTSGDTGDNTKLMFKTLKRGASLDLNKENLQESDLIEEGLRYDLTVPLARFFAAYRNELPFPFKAIQADEAFRAEKPQRGRNRQFTQCDIDIWGDETNLADIEIISTIMEAYNNLGLKNLVCKISSRKILNAIILSCNYSQDEVNDVCVVIDKLDKIGIQGCKEELGLRGYEETKNSDLMEKVQQIQTNGLNTALKLGAPSEEVKNIEQIIAIVKENLPENYNIIFDISIVRGQGYYTGTVFEIFATTGTYKGALSGGGRYDNMLENFVGERVPAVGATIGPDRVILIVEDEKIDLSPDKKRIAVLYNPENTKQEIFKAKNSLKENYEVSVFSYPKNFKEFARRLSNAGFYGYCKISKLNEITKF